MARKRSTASADTPAGAAPSPSRAELPTRRWKSPGGISDGDPYSPGAVAVYRLFNVPGALLYVGISDHPRRRFGQHSDTKRWWGDVATWTVEWLPDRASAEAEEARAIREEAPAYNLAGVPDVQDEQDRRAYWLAQFSRRRPCRPDLDALFLELVRLDSLPKWPQPRTLWTRDAALDMYVYAKDQALAREVVDHRRFIERWNAEQEVAWRTHIGEPEPPTSPSWPRRSSLRERLGLRLLGLRGDGQPKLPRLTVAVLHSWGDVSAAPLVSCTETGRPIVGCGCHTRHVASEEDVDRFGRPLGHPLGRRLSVA